MKKGVITGTIILASIGGLVLLNNDLNTKKPTIENSFNTETSVKEYSDKDCDDFSTQKVAQKFFEGQGGPTTDSHGLDRDRDGIACENME